MKNHSMMLAFMLAQAVDGSLLAPRPTPSPGATAEAVHYYSIPTLIIVVVVILIVALVVFLRKRRA